MSVRELEERTTAWLRGLKPWHWVLIWAGLFVFFPFALVALGSYVLLRPILDSLTRLPGE